MTRRVTFYQAAHVGQITAEMVRPDVSGKNWGGFDHEQLRIAALARAIQSRLPYLHHCNAVYCLKEAVFLLIDASSLAWPRHLPLPPYVQVAFDLHEPNSNKANTIVRFFSTDPSPAMQVAFHLHRTLHRPPHPVATELA